MLKTCCRECCPRGIIRLTPRRPTPRSVKSQAPGKRGRSAKPNRPTDSATARQTRAPCKARRERDPDGSLPFTGQPDSEHHEPPRHAAAALCHTETGPTAAAAARDGRQLTHQQYAFQRTRVRTAAAGKRNTAEYRHVGGNQPDQPLPRKRVCCVGLLHQGVLANAHRAETETTT